MNGHDYLFSTAPHLFAAATAIGTVPVVSMSLGAIMLAQVTPTPVPAVGPVLLSQNQLFTIAVFQSFVPGIAAIVAALIAAYLARKTAELHQQVNSRMDELMQLVEKKADLEGYNRGQTEAQAVAREVLEQTKTAAALTRSEAKEDRQEMRGAIERDVPGATPK